MRNDQILQILKHILELPIPFNIGLDPHIDVPTMTISMNKVVFHQHLEKRMGTYHCYCFVQFVRMLDVERYG